MTWVLLLASVPSQGVALLSSMLTAAGSPGAAASGQLLALGVTVPGLLLLLGPLGGTGAALVSLTAYTGAFAYLLLVARRRFDESLHDLLVMRRTDLDIVRELLAAVSRRLSPGRA
jgi:Na+-driven multidrug efflux pump